jgi:TonB family protein
MNEMPELALEARAVAVSEAKIAQTWVELSSLGASTLAEARPRSRVPGGARLGVAVSFAAHASLIAILLYARPPCAPLDDAAAIPIEIVTDSPSWDAVPMREAPPAETFAAEPPTLPKDAPMEEGPALPPLVDLESAPPQRLAAERSPLADPPSPQRESTGAAVVDASPPARTEKVEEAPQLSTPRDSPPEAEEAAPTQVEQGPQPAAMSADARPLVRPEASTAVSAAPPPARSEKVEEAPQPPPPQPQSADVSPPLADSRPPQTIKTTGAAAAEEPKTLATAHPIAAEETPSVPVEQSPPEPPAATHEAERAVPPPAPQRAMENTSTSPSVLRPPPPLQSSASLTSSAIETSPPRPSPAMPVQPSARARPKAPRVVARAEIQDRRVGHTSNAESQPAASAPARAGASPGEVDAYKSELVARINAAKRYPDEARTRGARGVAVVAFSINGSGGLGAASIQRTSGDSGLDGDAVATVRRAAPFPTPPLGAPRAYTVPLNYRLP